MRIVYGLKYEGSHLQNCRSMSRVASKAELTYISTARSSSSHQLLWTSVLKCYHQIKKKSIYSHNQISYIKFLQKLVQIIAITKFNL
jgi:hypothetical protein